MKLNQAYKPFLLRNRPAPLHTKALVFHHSNMLANHIVSGRENINIRPRLRSLLEGFGILKSIQTSFYKYPVQRQTAVIPSIYNQMTRMQIRSVKSANKGSITT